ncbi:unnamed protein product [Cochlearia groenlandica]
MISLVVEGFYDSDVDSMKHAAKLEKLVVRGREEKHVLVVVKMSLAMYAQEKFQAPNCYPMPSISDRDAYNKGLISGSKEYMRLMEKAEEYYNKGKCSPI